MDKTTAQVVGSAVGSFAFLATIIVAEKVVERRRNRKDRAVAKAHVTNLKNKTA